jgi:pimeloyl-ACP methyl ester carboxylesterase
MAGQVETLLLDHCGHSPHIDQPETVQSAAAGFLDACSSEWP